MSTEAVAWVLENSMAKGLDRLVLISLAFHANHKTGACFPSMRTIAREAGVSIGKVAKSIAHLVSLGELAIEKSGDHRRSTRYALPFLAVTSVHHVNAEFTSAVNAEFTPLVNRTTSNAKQSSAEVVEEEQWAEVVELIRPPEEVVQHALTASWEKLGGRVRPLRAAARLPRPGTRLSDARGTDRGDPGTDTLGAGSTSGGEGGSR